MYSLIECFCEVTEGEEDLHLALVLVTQQLS